MTTPNIDHNAAIADEFENILSCSEFRQALKNEALIKEPDLLDLLERLHMECQRRTMKNIKEYVSKMDAVIQSVSMQCNQQQKEINELQVQLIESKAKKQITKNKNTQLELNTSTDALCIHDQRGMLFKYIFDIDSSYGHRYLTIPKECHDDSTIIRNNEEIALVSLEQAVEPLVPVVTKVKRMVWTVKLRCETPADGLSSDESASVMLYSMQMEPNENSFYAILNTTICENDSQKLEPWYSYLRLFMTSLSKLPSVENQTIYRAATVDLSQQYPVGKTFAWCEFVACAKSVGLLERFVKKKHMKTLFKIECHNGKNIRQHSCFQPENEILLLPGQQFQVVAHLLDAQGLLIIHLMEADLVFPLTRSTLVEDAHANIATSASSMKYNNELKDKIAQYPPYQWIELNDLQLNDQDMETVVNEAIIRKQCQVLDLGRNNITAQGVSTIFNALPENKTIKRLYLGGNNLLDSGLRYLQDLIPRSSIVVLGLSETAIADEGAFYLSKMLQQNPRLVVLGLENNHIGDIGMKHLTVALKQNTKLERLLLANNSTIGDSSFEFIVDMLQYNQSLRRLDLRGCNFSKLIKKKLEKAKESKRNFDLWL